MKDVAYILVPGLGDQKPIFGWFYLGVGKWWRLHGMRMVFCRMNWVSTETYQEKIKRLEACIKRERQAGRRVVVVGVSAGGPMALIALATHHDEVLAGVSISGLLKLSAKDRASPLYAKTSWFMAADAAERLAGRLEREVRRHFLTISGTRDNIIRPQQERLAGAQNLRVRGRYHLPTIVRILLTRPRVIKRFVHELHR